ncbi:MAG TPA: YciI family protein [Vicinamibacterales bacterium]|jgi:hypothetical protein
MLMMHAPANAPAGAGLASWNPEEVHRMIRFMKDLNADLKSRGELVGAEGLEYPPRPRIVRASGNGAPIVTDGPFVETKEFLTGYWVVDVPTETRAFEIAAHASSCPGPGGAPLNMPIEIRQVMPGPPE